MVGVDLRHIVAYVNRGEPEHSNWRLTSMGQKWCIAALVFLTVGCSEPGSVSAAPQVSPSQRVMTPSPQATKTDDKKSWRKPRFISVAEAVKRLQRHVDVPVGLPRDRRAGLPNLKGWLADPKYLDWKKVDGVRAGGMKIRRGKEMLILSYGLAGFDGCGDRSMAIETNVVDQPALVNPSGRRWSTVIWPVTPTGSTGRYGISGTFDAVAMLRLAESMELARLEEVDVTRGC